MIRIIFERNHPSNAHLYQLAKVYDYEHNSEDYACIDVDEETLIYLRLRHVTWKYKFSYGSEMLPIMPTYVCHYE
jgi:hypothetical protein